MKKLRILFLAFAAITVIVQSGQCQQLSQYSQYLNNYYLINSAATDIQNNVQSFLAYRLGSGSYAGSPKSLYLAAYAPLKKPSSNQIMRSAMRVTAKLDTSALIANSSSEVNHLAGLSITTDQLGLFKKTTIHGSYTYHLNLTNKIRLAASPKLGWVNLNLADDLSVYEEGDQPFQDFVNRYQQINMMDIGFGLWAYSHNFFFGYSIEQLIKNKAYRSIEGIQGYEFHPHHFIMGGTRVAISARWTLVPSMLWRVVSDTPLSFDVSVKAEYGSRLWAALSYRKKTAMVFLVGGKINDRMSFSYSFDQTINATQANHISAHEITLQFQFLQNLY